ncbi:MAG: hypothetical protein ACOCZL_03455 [Bacteroidota bacterium]
MKNKMQATYFRIIFISIIPFFLTSCGTTVDFPDSDYLPAADVKAKIKKNESNIFEIKVEADHLAESERLEPSQKRYIVWVVDNDNANHNIGELDPDKSKEAELNTMTPFEPVQLLITAEDRKNPDRPSNAVIFKSEKFNIR